MSGVLNPAVAGVPRHERFLLARGFDEAVAFAPLLRSDSSRHFLTGLAKEGLNLYLPPK